MRQLRAWFLRLGGLFNKERRDRELAAEMESHLQLHIADNLRSGMTPEEARRQALIKLGGMEQAKEKYRERRGLPLLETLMQDLRYALRLLRKNPGFTIVAVLTLALGIGANSAVFSAVNAVLLRPLPYPDSDRLMMAFLENPKNESGRSSYGVADFLAARDRQQSFSHFAGISLARKMFTYTGGQEPIQVRGTAATADFFRVLGVEPLLGRTFTPGSDQRGKPREVVLSHGFWRSHFGSDPEIVGRTMFIDGDSCTIVAVMPAGFHFGPRGDDDLWPLLQLVPQNARPPFWIAALGRLKPGITEAQAQADLSYTAALVQQQFPGSTSYQSARLQGMKPFMVGDARLALYTLLGGVLLVLLIATVNVANLQVARATMREGEMAIRAALGAGRRRIIRQLLTESLLLAAVGGSLGLLLAAWGTTALLRLNPRVLPRMKEIHVDSQVLAFTAVVALFSGIVFGLTPVLHRFGSGLSESLKGRAGSPGENRGRRKLLASLVVVEFALALLLLTGAGLLIRSFDRLSSTRPGFSPEHLITMKLSLPSVRYSQETQVAGFHQQLLDRLQGLPGVQSAAISMSVPPNLLLITNPFRLSAEPIVPGKLLHLAEEMTISPGYFQTLGVPLLRGRFFNDSDRNRKDGILIINETMAKQFFPAQDPVGQRIQTGDPDDNGTWETIVGVVGNVKYHGLDGNPEPTLYVPYFEEGWIGWSREMYVVLRSSGDPQDLMPLVRNAVWGMDRELPIAEVRTMDQLLTESVVAPRFRTILLGVFALVALLLATAGVYGVISYSVTQRTREIGIRMALGAEPADVMRLVVGRGAILALIGVAISAVASLALTRLIAGLLYGVSPRDPVTLICVVVLLTLVALGASYVPARRAARVDPLVALRYE